MSSLGSARSGEGPLVIILHGFTQTRSSVAPLAELLGATRSVAAVDLPGHGTSSQVSADLDGTAALVVEVADGEPFDLVGYSLGGRVALHVACAGPPGLRATATIGASTGIVDATARATRLARDTALADSLAADGDVSAFVDTWLANPLFATVPADRIDAAGRRANTAEGLADSLRRCSVGAQRVLVDELGALSAPLLMLAGARDDPFLALACAAAASSRAVAVAAVPGAGHACHLERPELCARLIDSFLAGR